MVRIYFSPIEPGREVMPLAQACARESERTKDLLFERRFENLFKAAPHLWQAGTFEEAQLAVYSHSYSAGSETDALAVRARDAGLPCLFFSTSDVHTPCSPPFGTVYRSAIFLSKRTPHERAMPPICEDMLLYRDGRPQPRTRGPKPVVGFCGYVLPEWKTFLQALLGRADKAQGHLIRRVALRVLTRSQLIGTNLLVRNSYWGGAVRHGKDPRLVANVREEFVRNMFECDYVLCARGAGNFSYRFYEALSAGRIPLLIDTDCALPFSDRINWRRHCVFVDAANISDAPKILSDFHSSLSDAQFAALQEANRLLWEQYLNPLSFLRIAVDDAIRGGVPAGPFG